MTIDPSKLSEAIARAKKDWALFEGVDVGPEQELAAVLIAAAEETLERMLQKD
jgi:hypothetical protein